MRVRPFLLLIRSCRGVGAAPWPLPPSIPTGHRCRTPSPRRRQSVGKAPWRLAQKMSMCVFGMRRG